MERVKHRLLPAFVAALMSLFSACAALTPAPESSAGQRNAELAEQKPRVPDEYLVTLAPDTDESVIFDYYQRFGIKYLHRLEGETYLLILSNDPGPRAMDLLIENEARIRLVQPNLVHWDYR